MILLKVKYELCGYFVQENSRVILKYSKTSIIIIPETGGSESKKGFEDAALGSTIFAPRVNLILYPPEANRLIPLGH